MNLFNIPFLRIKVLKTAHPIKKNAVKATNGLAGGGVDPRVKGFVEFSLYK